MNRLKKRPVDYPYTHWLAMSREAEWWNAFYTAHENLLDAELIGSIQWKLIDKSPLRKNAFKAMMQEIVDEMNGIRPTTPPLAEDETKP